VKLDRLVPMLAVTDLSRSVAFYQQLGFEVESRNDDWGWASLRLGTCRLMLDVSTNGHPGPIRRSVIYLYPDDLEAYHREARANGLVLPEISSTFYGMREFRIDDPDGNHLWVGREAPSHSA
jgi:catechol 2,3-dioxygenase-like lactoylglutathione lyase family enzyme